MSSNLKVLVDYLDYDFNIKKFNKKGNEVKKFEEIKLSPLYEKMRIIYNQIQNNEITYEDLIIDKDDNTKKKTI